MSGIEALVAAFGLFIGYWLVAKLLSGSANSGDADWHDTLGVSPHASVDEIENAYRTLMNQQPDKSNELTAAYRRAMQVRGVAA